MGLDINFRWLGMRAALMATDKVAQVASNLPYGFAWRSFYLINSFKKIKELLFEYIFNAKIITCLYFIGALHILFLWKKVCKNSVWG